MPIEKRRSYEKNYDTGQTVTFVETIAVCQWCTVKYWAKRSTSKFCSSNCRVLNHLAKSKKKY